MVFTFLEMCFKILLDCGLLNLSIAILYFLGMTGLSGLKLFTHQILHQTYFYKNIYIFFLIYFEVH